jgi:beta-lactamase regulating signal transducer with metallopeptidase domain/Flp pilus assembly protein TadD
MRTIFELAGRIQSANTLDSMLLLLAKATLVLLIARVLLAAIPRASAATKHLIATAALVAVASMPFLGMVVPAWEIAVAEKPAAVAAVRLAAEQKTIGVRDDVDTVPVTRSLAKAIVPSQMQKATAVVSSTWKGMLVVAAAAVSLLMLGHMLFGMLGVWFVARSGVPFEDDQALIALDDARDQLALRRDIRLLLSSRVTVPVIWGVFRPVLLLPPDAVTWSSERMRVVLLHELAHLKRIDGVSLILTRIAVSLFWFHPVAWSLERAGRNECERACDDLVLAGGTKPSEYADHLLAIARTMPAFDPFRSVTLAMSRKSQLEGRLLSILQPGGARRVFSGRGVLVACAIAIGVIVPVSALRLIAQPSKPQPQAKPLVNTAQSGTVVDVKPQVDTLEEYLTEKIEKIRKHHESTYDRAYDLYRHEQYAEAAEEFVRANEEEPNATALYNAACSFALTGDAARASKTLREAIEAGWDDFDKIAEDSDFDPIRENPQFSAVLASYGSDTATRRVKQAQMRLDRLREGRKADDPDEWYEAGVDLLRLRKLDESIEAFTKAIEHGEKNGPSAYNIACAYALRGDTANALTSLDQAIENGYGDEDKLREDPDIASIRRTPEFARLLQKARDLEMHSVGNNHSGWTLSWDAAAAHHRQMLDRYPNSGRAWFNYGFTSLQARDFAAAMKAFQRTKEMNYRPGTSAYNLACAYALQENKDAAFEWLARAESEGFELGNYLRSDDDLDALHGDPRWKALKERAKSSKEW